MKYLFDTHYLLWSIFQPEKIELKILEILENNQDDKFVSSISFWEISLKYTIGKIELFGSDPEQIYNTAIESGFEIIEPTANELASVFKLPIQENHKDPFDRVIIWQAIKNNLTLVTKDAEIKKYEQYGLNLYIENREQV